MSEVTPAKLMSERDAVLKIASKLANESKNRADNEGFLARAYLELEHTLSALSQEAVRDEALEEVAQMAQDRAASEHDDFSEFAHDVRALKREPHCSKHTVFEPDCLDCSDTLDKREPNAAARTRCSVSFEHPPHDYCDGNPGAKFFDAAGPTPAAPDVASMVKQAEQNAQYWLKAGYEEPHRDLAVLNVEQAMNAYKNAMYALLARLGQGWIPVSDGDGKPLPELAAARQCVQ